MNPQASQFQLQYPLDVAKKFRKKMIARIPAMIGMALVLTFIVIFVAVAFGITSFSSNSAFISYVVTVLVISVVAVLILTVWYLKAYIRHYYYSADESFLTIKKGVFAPTEIHVQYQKIQDVYVDQDILDRMMGLYDVHIASATMTSGIEAHIDGVDAGVAESLKVFLLDRIRTGNSPVQAQTQAQPQIQTQPQSAPNPAAAAAPANGYSSASYPIESAWLISNTIKNIVGAIVFVAVISGFVGTQVLKFSFLNLGELTQSAYIVNYSIIVVLLAIITTIRNILWKKFYYFELAQDFILMKEGIISKQEQHVPYARVQDVIVSQGILDRLLGLYNVVIQNAVVSMVSSGSSRNRQQPTGITIPGQSKDRAYELLEVIRGAVQARQGTSQTGL
jgi:putative membrane protein